LKRATLIFDYEKDNEGLKDFIKKNIKNARTNAKIRINKNNFLRVYNKRVEYIKPKINVDREDLKKNDILDSDFFLADLLVDDLNTQTIDDDKAIKKDLFVTYEN